MTRRWLPELALVLVAVAFGSTFLVVQDAVETADPAAFLAIRFAVGGFGLWGLVLLRNRTNHSGAPSGALAQGPLSRDRRRPLLFDGVAAGLALTVGYASQTIGLQYTTSTVSALLTALLVIVVPVLSLVALRQRPALATVLATPIALTGLLLLTGGPGSTVALGRGEVLTLVCAVGFATHIVILAASAPHHPAVTFAAVQLTVVALGTGAVALVTVGPSGFVLDRSAIGAAVYTGLVASAFAFAGQTWAQRHVPPSRAALILLMEPVSAAWLGYLVGERLGPSGWVGAALILGALVIAEVGSVNASGAKGSHVDANVAEQPSKSHHR